MFKLSKVNNKDTTTMFVVSIVNFEHISYFIIAEFKQVNTGWL